MPIMLANNWENFFKDNPTNEDSNKTMVALFELFGAPKNPAKCLQAAIEEQDTVFIAKAPVSNHIMFIHHFTKIGGTRTNPTKHLFAHVGTGNPSYPGHVTEASLFTPHNTSVPAWTNLKAVDTEDAVTALVTRANAAPKEFRPIMPLPPFLAVMLIDQGGSCIPELILTAARAIRAFDAEHGGEATFPSANTQAQCVVNWLYAANSDTFPTVTATPSIAPSVLSRAEDTHKAHIHTTAAPTETEVIQPGEAINQLANNVNEQTVILQEMNYLATEHSKEKEKKKGISSIHPSFKIMILNASSPDGTTALAEPGQQCIDFYAQKSPTHAKIHLLQTLTHVHGCTVDITVPLATALYYGSFLWDRPDSPNNFCSLLFGKPNPLSSTGAREAMLLHLKANKGSGWSDKDLDKVLQQAIIIPSSVDSMLHSIHNMAAASHLFFTEQSLLTTGLRSWRKEISRNLIVYESQAVQDPEFIARILTAIDTRVNCWLNECMTQTSRCGVDDELVDFSDMHRQIKTRQFNFSLPPSVRKHVGSTKRNKREDETNEEQPPKRTPVHNQKRIHKWKLKEGENYKEKFGNAHVDKRPLLNGVRVCPRWHIKGVCWSECNLKATHCEITDASVIADMDKYCRLCRE